jgi:DNA-directed RNA polymerase sigma subunit (sigma70/sigma32)
MSDIEYLIAEREKVRENEKKLTAQIKDERARLSVERKKAKATDAIAGVTLAEWRMLKSENARLRGMIAALLKDTGLTYKQLGEKLYCSPGRAREIVERALRQLRHPSVYRGEADT